MSKQDMHYHHFQEIKVNDFDEAGIEQKYREGFVFTRLGRGVMHQVRSVRVPLGTFELSSENRRILKKHEEIIPSFFSLQQFAYHWTVGKMATDFYRTKFGPGVVSANKIKEMCIDPEKSNVNGILEYGLQIANSKLQIIAYCLAYSTSNILHYAYPFYDLALAERYPSLGMGMMTKAVLWAKEQQKQHIYLGSIQDEKSRYKFQFKGVEWFDGKIWKQGKPTV